MKPKWLLYENSFWVSHIQNLNLDKTRMKIHSPFSLLFFSSFTNSSSDHCCESSTNSLSVSGPNIHNQLYNTGRTNPWNCLAFELGMCSGKMHNEQYTSRWKPGFWRTYLPKCSRYWSRGLFLWIYQYQRILFCWIYRYVLL